MTPDPEREYLLAKQAYLVAPKRTPSLPMEFMVAVAALAVLGCPVNAQTIPKYTTKELCPKKDPNCVERNEASLDILKRFWTQAPTKRNWCLFDQWEIERTGGAPIDAYFQLASCLLRETPK